MKQPLGSEIKPKRKRFRSCLIVFLGYLGISLVIVCFFGGCCTTRAIDYNCPRRARLEDRHFGLSPDGREIVYSSVLGIYRQDPLRNYSRRSEGPHFEKRIPMDPVPDGMFRFEIAVDVSPDHPPYEMHTAVPAPMIEIWVPLERLNADGTLMDESAPLANGLALHPDDVIQMKLRPEDLPLLNRAFYLMILPRDGIKITPNRTSLEANLILVFPYRKEGDRYVMLTSQRNGIYHPPFEDEFFAIAKEETREHGVKGGLFLVGGAFLLDVVCLPAEVLYWIGREIYRRF